jgi:hypothetical protein
MSSIQFGRTISLLALLIIAAVTATDYYIEPSPVAPRLCTLARPCSYGLLPTLTSADTVHFLPATTGTSNTYSLGTRTINSASVVVDSPLIVFSNTPLPFLSMVQHSSMVVQLAVKLW